MRGKKTPQNQNQSTNQNNSPHPQTKQSHKKNPNQQNKNPPQTRNTEGMKVMEILLQLLNNIHIV